MDAIYARRNASSTLKGQGNPDIRTRRYVGGLKPPAIGQALISLKPRTSTMVRALVLLSLASFVSLAAIRRKFDPIAEARTLRRLGPGPLRSQT
jgi:hypothetical protein